MVRLSVELLEDAPQYINPVRERELNLRGYKIPVVGEHGSHQMWLKDQFDYIDMTDNDIKRVENFPLLKRLTALYLHNNRVQFIQPNLGEKLPNLKTLTLTNNNLCELGDVDGLTTCTKLEYVTFIGNPLTHKPHYREYVIYKLPSVRVLDFKRVRLAEREKAKKMFKGKKNAKKREQVAKRSAAELAEEATEKENAGVGRAVTDEDKKKIKEAIKSAKNIAEVEFLQSILQSGRIPDKGWNRQMELPSDKATEKLDDQPGEEFQIETEEAADVEMTE